MRIHTLYIDYGWFMAPFYVPLAVGDGLGHGHAAPAMFPGIAGTRDPLGLLRRRVIRVSATLGPAWPELGWQV
jgi:hypothetical protein